MAVAWERKMEMMREEYWMIRRLSWRWRRWGRRAGSIDMKRLRWWMGMGTTSLGSSFVPLAVLYVSVFIFEVFGSNGDKL